MIYRLEAARLNDILKFRIRLRHGDHSLIEEGPREEGGYYAVIETGTPITIHSGLVDVYEQGTEPTS